jgi:SAM-dependent methyltransferase
VKPPPCPITGEPAVRLIQELHPKLLTKLWRWGAHVDVGHLLLAHNPIRLWESPCGLAFFDPMIEGDETLYPAFYRNVGADRWLFGDPDGARAEFAAAAELISSGDGVLDVGCGEAAFRRRIPQARYTGIDPFASQEGDGILRQSAQQHAQTHAGAYDVVCGFEVLEHTADPLGLARAMVELLRPGGLFIASVPVWPSPLVEIPNLAANAPPHHLSWWSPQALQALCQALGLEVISARELPPQPQHRVFHWMHRLSPAKVQGPYFRHDWGWHASVVFAFLAAQLVTPFASLPAGARPIDAFVAGRKAIS